MRELLTLRHTPKQCERDNIKREWIDKTFKPYFKPRVKFVSGTTFQHENRRAENKKAARQSFQFDYFSPQISGNSFKDEENF
jgi:hypothetical protein